MSNFAIKQGVSFQLTCVFRDASGVPVSLSGCDVQSQIRDSQSALIATLDCVQPVGVRGCVNIFWPGSTRAWVPGRYFCDVVVTQTNGVIAASETFGVIVNSAVTQLGSTT